MNKKLLSVVIGTAVLMVAMWPATSYSAMKHCWVAALREAYQEALRLCRPLAEQGDPVAQNALAGLYYTGDGVPQDYAEAAKWYRFAAEQNHAEAQYNLGLLVYYIGRGESQDNTQALMWLSLAASQGNQTAQKTHALVEKQAAPAEITEALRMAREWIRKSWAELSQGLPD